MKPFIYFLTLLRLPMVLLFGGIWTIFMSVVAVVSSVMFHNRRIDDSTARLWSKVLLASFGVRVHVRGVENIPEGGVLFLFNHQSLIDIPAIFVAIPRGVRFGGKIELFSIPVFGHALKATGMLPIPRQNRAQAFRVYEDASRRFRENGESFALAPEGTRQDRRQLGEFKSGPFVLGINAQVPVVPVVLAGLDEIMPPRTWWVNLGALSRTVQVEILRPHSTAGLTFDDRENLKNQVRQSMIPVFDRLHGAMFGHHPPS